MKKVFFTLALLVLSLATYAQATIPSNCTMSVKPFTIVPGNSATFGINLESSARDDVNSFQVYVNIPNGWGLSNATTTSRTDGYAVDCPSDGGSATRFYVYGYHPQNQVLDETDGAIIYLTLTAPANAEGTYTITCDGAMLSNGGEELDVDDFTFDVTVTDRMILDENSTTPFVDAEGVDVTVNRTLKGGVWNTIVLPFEGDPEELFGEGAQLAEFESLKYEGTTSTSSMEISFSITDWVEPGIPYIVKPVNDINTIEADGVDVEFKESISIYKQTNGKSGSKYRSTFNGTYLANTIIPENSFFISNGKFYVASTETSKMKAFRGYFTPIYNGAVVTLVDSEVKMVFVDGVETSIEGINGKAENENVYSIDGKYVGKDITRLHKGVYVVNGKKVIK